jgi:pyruvate/2-oxoglutarate dehydrogenase complex dihydrolipoamide acyltransferase (E2) component
MTSRSDGYQIVPYPLQRRVIADSVRVGRRKNTMFGLIELDVTQARRQVREYRQRTGEALSFTAFIIACLGKAVGENKEVHGYRNWRNQIVIFDDVDITTLIETDVDGAKFPLAHVIRAANRRSFREIHDEIRRVQTDRQAVQNAENVAFMRTFLLLPAFLRDMFYAGLLGSPHLMKKYIGTVMLSAVNMFGMGSGWAVSPPVYNLSVTLGGIARKPVVAHEQIVIGEIMSATLTFDHDIVDGAPAARFAATFKKLIETGDGLTEVG